MLLEELELVLPGRSLEQVLEFTQMPDAVGGSQLAGGFDVGRRVFGGQLQEALQHAEALRTAVFNHRFGPVARVLAEEPGAIQQPVQTVFNRRPLAAVDVRRIGAEAPRLLPGMQGDLFHARVEDPHQTQLPPRPHFAPHIFRRHGVVSAGHFHVAIAVNGARGFGKDREDHRRQGPQLGLLARIENGRDLLARGAMNAGIGHPAFPFQQKLVLGGQTLKPPPLERVVLPLFDAGLDLAFVAWRIGLGGQNDRLIMLRKGDDLGIELRIEPVGLRDRHFVRPCWKER